MISNIESAKEELFTLYNEKINIIINELEKYYEHDYKVIVFYL